MHFRTTPKVCQTAKRDIHVLTALTVAFTLSAGDLTSKYGLVANDGCVESLHNCRVLTHSPDKMTLPRSKTPSLRSARSLSLMDRTG